MALETGNYIANLVAANPPGTDPKSAGDDHLRLIKNALLNCFPGFTGSILITGTDGGAANAYTITSTPALLAYSTRLVVAFSPTADNTGAATLNISGLGAKDIRTVDGVAASAGDLVSGVIYLAVYTGTFFQLTGITKRYADQLAFSAALPGQGGNAGKFLTTDGTSATWQSVPMTLRYSPRTANAILTEADRGTLIDITANSFTQTFTAAATLGAGWWCKIRNSTTNDIITLDPNGAELIDGLASYPMYPGETRVICVNSTATGLVSTVETCFRYAFTVSGTFTTPPGYRDFEYEIWNGGNSGGRGNTSFHAHGGGGGGYHRGVIPASLMGASQAITVAAGGTSVVAGTQQAGNLGGASSIGSIVVMQQSTAGGNGSALVAMTSNIPVGFEGQGVQNTPASPGGGAGASYRTPWGGSGSANSSGAASGSAIYGGAAGGNVSTAGVLGAAGTSIFGGNGGAASNAGNGTAGTAPGGGGGATQTGQSGVGAIGEVRIRGLA